MLKALKKFRYLLDKKSRIQFSMLFFLLLIRSILDGFGIGLIAPYIAFIGNPKMVFENTYFIKINVYLGIESNLDLIIYLSLILIIFFLFKNIISLCVNYYESKLVFSKRALQHSKLLSLYIKSPYTYHLEHNSAELDRNIKFNSGGVYVFLQNILLLLYNVFLAISISIVLLIVNWQAVLSIGVMISIISIIFLSLSKKYIIKLGEEVQESMLKSGQALSEGLNSIIELKLYGIEDYFPKRLYKAQMDNARANWIQNTINAIPKLFFEVIAIVVIAGVIIFFTLSGISINDVLPVLAVFSFAFVRLIPSVTTIMKSIQQINFTTPAVNIIYSDFVNLSKLIKTRGNKDQQQGKIEKFQNLIIENMAFTFNKNNSRVLSDINLEIHQGDAIGITGPSGCGKTTLLNIILGLLKADSGNISVNSKNIFLDLLSWRSLIGYVPQSITLIDASIKQNVALGLDGIEINNEKVWSSLKEANLDIFVKDLPKQIDTIIGENGIRLSGGQRQRLGLARSLYRDPEILIFDEATSSLDIETEKKITQEIMKLSGKRTLIIVAHRVSTIKNCDRIYYLKDGKIRNSGPYEDLAEKNRDFKSLIDNFD